MTTKYEYLTIVVRKVQNASLPDVDLTASLLPPKSRRKTNRAGITDLANFLASGAAANPQIQVFAVETRDTSAAAAACYAECSSAPDDGDIYTLCGVTFTFKTSPDINDPLQVLIGSASATMVNLAAAINANFFLTQIGAAVKSAPSAQRVTFTALMPGPTGNNIITQTKTSTNLSLSAAAATGGAMGIIPNAGQGAAFWSVGVP